MNERISISETTRIQDEYLLSNIEKKYRPFAKRLIAQYSTEHPFYNITKKYHNDVKRLKEAINEALINRNAYVLYILNEFRSIK